MRLYKFEKTIIFFSIVLVINLLLKKIYLYLIFIEFFINGKRLVKKID
jgi:hypothetical protein